MLSEFGTNSHWLLKYWGFSCWNCSKESPLLQTVYAKQWRNALSTTSNKPGLRSHENYTVERFSFIQKAALIRISLFSSWNPLPHIISSSCVPQKAEILLSGYLQRVNLSPLFSVLFNISILTFFFHMNLITLTLQFLHFGQVALFTMLSGLNNAKRCNGHGYLWETVEGLESVCLVWFFSSCFICMLF